MILSQAIDGKEVCKDGWKIRYHQDGEIRVKSQISEFSVDSTEVTQLESSLARQPSNTTDFKHTEIVWAKRSAKPWYPAILFTDPFDQSKEMKHLMKQLDVTHVPFSHDNGSDDCHTQDLKNVLLFDTHKTWLLLPADRIRKFDLQGFNQYYLHALRQLNYKERNDIKKAYKRANKLFAKKKTS